jgi:hypothetical protein
MAQILITNYTGTVASDIIACEANLPGPTIGTCYNVGQITPTTSLPAWYTLPTSFDYDQYCYIQLSASTTLFTVPQLVLCGIDPPGTWGFESCGLQLDKNIYVYYDTSTSYPDGVAVIGPAIETLSGASTAIRTWYYNLVQNSGYTGNLYEIPVVNERYVNWPCYPYLGSTTGGTLSDSTNVRIEMGSVTYSDGSNGNVASSQVVRRMALGQDLATGNPLPNTLGYSKGVPFNHSNYTLAGCQLANIGSQDTNYISIIVLNESCVERTGPSYGGCLSQTATSGGTNFIQPYFEFNQGANASFVAINNIPPTVLNPNNPQPVIRVPNFCPAFGGYSSGSYSGSSIQRDYESWLKVWEDVNINLNGFANVFLFPVPTQVVTAASSFGPIYQAQGYGTLYQAIELLEAEIPYAPSYFQSKYCEGLFDTTGTQWPYPNQRYNAYSATTNGQYFDFTPLSYFNKFTVFSGTSAYQNLPLQYQVGPGLKNFGWAVDATITGFTQSLVENDLNAYLTNILSGSKIYTFTEPTDITEGSIYTLQDFEGCWEYTGYRLDGQPAYPEITTLNEFGSCFDCENNETPLTVQFKYNGVANVYSSAGFISTASTASSIEQIVIIGSPNDTVDIQFEWPFPIGTDIPNAQFSIYDGNAATWTNYPLGTTSGFSSNLDSSGYNVLEYKLISGTFGFEYINFSITATTQGATLIPVQGPFDLYVNPPVPLFPTPSDTAISFIKLPAPGANTYMMVAGVSTVSAATSATSCSDYSVQKSYLINPAPQSNTLDYIVNNFGTIPFRFQDAQTQNVVNGGNNWISVSNCKYTVYGYTPVTIAIQVDSGGYITNAVMC